MNLAITGHRPRSLNNEYDLVGPMTNWIKSHLNILIKDLKPDIIISGMALGVDLLMASLAIENSIPLLAAIPCDNQEKIWPKKSQDLYNNMLSYEKCTKFIVCPGPYNNYCMFKRNEFMVDKCDCLISVWDGSNGGTGHCVNYAQKVGKKIIRIDPNDFYKGNGRST